MLLGTCLGEALKFWHQDLDSIPGSDNGIGDHGDGDGGGSNEYGGPDGNGEGGDDLDMDQDQDGDNGAPGPVDGPSILSEVVLALKKGIGFLCANYIKDHD